MADGRPETLLIFDNATVVLEMGREGKIVSKAEQIGGKRCHEMLEKPGSTGPLADHQALGADLRNRIPDPIVATAVDGLEDG